MDIFDKPNYHGLDRCPICLTQKKEPVVLVGISGTEEGNVIEAKQIHVSCLSLTIFKDQRIIAQKY